MDVSVLIPVYNYNISTLVSQLDEQFKKLNLKFEILLIDDCSELSSTYLNLKVNQIEHVKYEVLTENIGRAAIRNLLFNNAKYNFCICLDCDMHIENDNFINNYINEIEQNTILIGGHYYQKSKPNDEKLFLHWKYGSEIESKNISLRDNVFMSSNFACNKNTFQQIKFDNSLKKYGHEDTLFGILANQKNIKLKKINNTLLHCGIETNTVFLEKQKQAIKNLKYLYKNLSYSKEFANKIKLIKYANFPFIGKILQPLEPLLLKNLKSNKPNLYNLQILKIIWWHKN